MSMSKQQFPLTTVAKLGFDAYTSFKAIVEIAKTLAISLQKEVTSIVGGILTFGGMLIGGLIGGARGVTAGGLAGATIAHKLTVDENFVSLAEYLLHKLPEKLKHALVKVFQILLTPFHMINTAVETISKSPELISIFKKILQKFLLDHNEPYRIAH